jgi:2-methylisocitrate lyase-like PEP mutase family enzyme
MVKKTSLLKELIMSKGILVMPGAFDALSARIVEQTGFKYTTLFNEFNQIVGLQGIRDIETHYYQGLLSKK